MKNPYIQLIRTTWHYAKGRRTQYVIAYILFIFANLAMLLNPLLIGWLINHLQINGLTEINTSILLIVIGFVGIDFLFWIFHGSGRIMERLTSYHVTKNFKQDIYSRLTSLPIKWHKDNHSGSIMSRIEKASSSIKDFSDGGFQYHQVIVRFLGSLIALFVLDLTAGIIAIIFAFLITFTIFRFDKILIKYLEDINKKWHLFDATFYDYISNIRTIITLRLEKISQNQTFLRFAKILPIWRKQNKLNELKWFVITMLISSMFVVVCSVYLYQQSLSQQIFLIGTFVALYEYVDRFTEVFFDLAWKYETLVQMQTNLKSIDQIIKDSNQIKQTKTPKTPKNWQTLQIQNLNFRYQDEKHKPHHLKNINITLQKGQRLAFVGHSGSGKSTLMSLLRGLEQANCTLTIQDKTYSDLSPLKNQTTLIPQSPEIFENTIEYNVTAGLKHNKKDLQQIIKLARFTQVVKNLPNGLQTNIKEKGVNLSGGEVQRLALARGIFAAQKSQIILLDEPTSSIDPTNEAKIYKNLFTHFKKQCLISSIHRLHLLPQFHYIYLFKNGQIIAEGTFEHLQKSSKQFQKMLENYYKNQTQTATINP